MADVAELLRSPGHGRSREEGVCLDALRQPSVATRCSAMALMSLSNGRVAVLGQWPDRTAEAYRGSWCHLVGTGDVKFLYREARIIMTSRLMSSKLKCGLVILPVTAMTRAPSGCRAPVGKSGARHATRLYRKQFGCEWRSFRPSGGNGWRRSRRSPLTRPLIMRGRCRRRAARLLARCVAWRRSS
jgi:hypothetical protein